MLKHLAGAAALAIVTSVGAFAQEADKSKEWCTDAHMKQMDELVAKASDAKKKTEASAQLQMSKDAMKKGDMDACVKHMTEAHKALGL